MARRFVAFGSDRDYLYRPDRPYPPGVDPPEVIARIRDATSTCDEPEAPSSAWVDAYAQLGREYDRLRRLARAVSAQQIRAELTVDQRLAELQRKAKLQRVDMTRELYVMRRMREHNPRAMLARLERNERRLDGAMDA